MEPSLELHHPVAPFTSFLILPIYTHTYTLPSSVFLPFLLTSAPCYFLLMIQDPLVARKRRESYYHTSVTPLTHKHVLLLLSLTPHSPGYSIAGRLESQRKSHFVLRISGRSVRESIDWSQLKRENTCIHLMVEINKTSCMMCLPVLVSPNGSTHSSHRKVSGISLHLPLVLVSLVAGINECHPDFDRNRETHQTETHIPSFR